jgi:hypothetical protein
VEKAVSYMDKDELPPHWDRDALFGAPSRGDNEFGDSDSEVILHLHLVCFILII